MTHVEVDPGRSTTAANAATSGLQAPELLLIAALALMAVGQGGFYPSARIPSEVLVLAGAVVAGIGGGATWSRGVRRLMISLALLGGSALVAAGANGRVSAA